MRRLAPYAALATAAFLLSITIATKWSLLGRMREGRHVLWSCWCSHWDFLFEVWSAYARPVIETVEGTPLVAWWLRAMGVRIGRRVVLGTSLAQLVDPDMLEIDDDATVACHLQLHSFEDRVLKIGRSRIGAGECAPGGVADHQRVGWRRIGGVQGTGILPRLPGADPRFPAMLGN